MPDPRQTPFFQQDPRFESVYRTDVIPRGPSLFGLNPTAPSSPLEGALQSLVPLLTEYLRKQTGGYGFQFGTDMNVANSEFARVYLQQTLAARNAGAAADAQQVQDLYRGLAVAIGHKPVERDFRTGQVRFDKDLERAIERLAADTGGMLPVLAAMFPDTIDRVLPRGSLTVAAGSFANAGRFVVDPQTGRPVAADPEYAAKVLQPLLMQDPRATAGLGAGRLGQTYEELVRLGIMDPGADLRRQVVARDQALAAFGGTAPEGLGIGLEGQQAKDIQVERTRERLKQYSQTIAAINDIFAESGRPNAPMAELVRGLQTLTQGGLGAYDPAELAMLTRRLQAAGQLSGISLDGLVQLSQSGGVLLRQYGGHRALAAPTALYGVAQGDAYARLGFGAPSFEGMTRDEWVARAMRDQAAAAGSPMGNLVGAFLYQARFAPGGSDLRAVAAALQRGDADVALADGTRFDLRTATQADYEGVFRRSGLDPANLQRQLLAPNQNQAALAGMSAEGRTALFNRMQRGEVERLVAAQIGMDLDGPDNGLTAEQRQMLLPALFDVAGSGKVTTDFQLADQVGERLKLTNNQRAILSTNIGRAGLLYDPTGQTGGNVMFRRFSPQATGEAAGRLQEFDERARMTAALTHLGRGGWVRNISNAIRDMGFAGEADWFTAVMKGFGLVTDQQVEGALGRRDPFAFPGVPDPLAGLVPDWLKLADPQWRQRAVAGVRPGNQREAAVLPMVPPGFGGGRLGGGLGMGGGVRPVGPNVPAPGSPEDFIGGRFSRAILAAATWQPGGPLDPARRGGAAPVAQPDPAVEAAFEAAEDVFGVQRPNKRKVFQAGKFQDELDAERLAVAGAAGGAEKVAEQRQAVKIEIMFGTIKIDQNGGGVLVGEGTAFLGAIGGAAAGGR